MKIIPAICGGRKRFRLNLRCNPLYGLKKITKHHSRVFVLTDLSITLNFIGVNLSNCRKMLVWFLYNCKCWENIFCISTGEGNWTQLDVSGMFNSMTRQCLVYCAPCFCLTSHGNLSEVEGLESEADSSLVVCRSENVSSFLSRPRMCLKVRR